MFYELKNEQIIIDLENLVQSTKDFDEDLSSYASFMREQILCVNGNN